MESILEEFGYLLGQYEQHPRQEMYPIYKRTMKRLEVTFPFTQHPHHGITGLHCVETYDDAGYVKRYQYNWKVIIPKAGIIFSHISAWGNDPHDDPATPEEYRVDTEPHHHHYDPNNRKKRRENYDVMTLKDAFLFIQHYLVTGEEYTGQ
jgi:Family of unknown function (DUF6516)